MKVYSAIRSRDLSLGYESRYVIVDTLTQAVLDDAGGCGYQSYDEAMHSYRAKHKRTLFQRKQF